MTPAFQSGLSGGIAIGGLCMALLVAVADRLARAVRRRWEREAADRRVRRVFAQIASSFRQTTGRHYDMPGEDQRKAWMVTQLVTIGISVPRVPAVES